MNEIINPEFRVKLRFKARIPVNAIEKRVALRGPSNPQRPRSYWVATLMFEAMMLRWPISMRKKRYVWAQMNKYGITQCVSQ